LARKRTKMHPFAENLVSKWCPNRGPLASFSGLPSGLPPQHFQKQPEQDPHEVRGSVAGSGEK
jgi:hypothetical protein